MFRNLRTQVSKFAPAHLVLLVAGAATGRKSDRGTNCEQRKCASKFVPALNVILFAFAGVAFASSQEESRARKPNIVFILADDMGYGDVGAFNPDSKIPTPNLDRLASEGIRFTDAHSASYCVPTRYALLTGRYMWRTRLGSGGNMANFAGTLIEPGRITLPEVLRREGYFTALVGKWHQGIDWKLHDESEREVIRTHPNYQDFKKIDFAAPALRGPKDSGFDYSFGTAGSAEMNPATFIENNVVSVIPTLTAGAVRARRGEWYGRDDNIIAEGYTMDALVPTLSAKALDVLDRVAVDPARPFFLYYAMTTPHNPIVPNKEFVGTSRAGAYGDFVVELDNHIGRLLQKLAVLGIEKQTIIFFTSDNGPVNRTQGYRQPWVRGDTLIYGHSCNGPFSGWKASLQEGGHRVPFIVRWPGRIKPGEVCSTTILINDVIPTVAELLNIQLDRDTAEDGISFLPALTGKRRPASFHEAIVHNHSDGTFAIRQGSYKLIVNGPKTNAQVIDDSHPVTFVLHDLQADPKETADISKAHPAIVKTMHALLKKYVRDGRSNGR
jgi:arylsulfatase A